MKFLLVIGVILMLIVQPVKQLTLDEEIIKGYSQKYGIDYRLVIAHSLLESSGKGFDDENRVILRFESHLMKCELANSVFFFNETNPHYDQTFISTSGERKLVNENQATVREAMSIAKFLCGDMVYDYLSIGRWQMNTILSDEIGFPNSYLMYSYLSESPEHQISLYFRYISRKPVLLNAFKNNDIQTICNIWNFNSKEYYTRFVDYYNQAVLEYN